MEEIHASQLNNKKNEDINNLKNEKNEEINSNENKFKFNNISLPNTIKETKSQENENKQNKFSNYNMLLDLGLDIKNIPVYNSFEEIAEWPADLNNNVIKGIMGNAEKIGDKLIQLDTGNNNQKIILKIMIILKAMIFLIFHLY